MRKAYTLGFTLIASVLGLSNAAAAQQLNAQEVEALFAKPLKISYLTPSGGSGRAEYAPDRNMWVDISLPRALSDKGTYRLDGDKGCFKWKTLRDGKEVCFNFIKRPDGRYDTMDGATLNNTFEIR